MTAMQVVAAALATAAVTLAVTWPLARWLAAVNLVDRPNERSMHTGAVPRGGGAGIAVAVSVVTVVMVAMGLDDRVYITLAIALGLSAVGFADDRFNLPATPRVLAQLTVAGAAIAMIHDSTVSSSTNWPVFLSAFLTIVWILGACNAVNFMDGINALTALNMVVFGAHLVVIGYHDDLVRLPAALLAGSAIGFLYWNAIRNKLFLGDGGAYFIGAYVALLVVLASIRTSAPLIAAAPFAIYAADTATAFGRRVARREPLTEGHRTHVYQRLVLQGRPHVPVAFFVAACSAACAGASIAVDRNVLPPVGGATIVGGVIVAYLSAPRWLPLVSADAAVTE